MTINQIYLWSKKIHNLTMWGTVLLSGWMMISGLLMHRQLEGDWIPVAETAMVGVRGWHNELSQWLVLFLTAQIVTGLLMWGVPLIIKNLKLRVQKEEEK